MTSTDARPFGMAIRGYTPRWQLLAGDTLGVHVSSTLPAFNAMLCRLDGPIESPYDWKRLSDRAILRLGPFTASSYPIDLGSFMVAQCRREDTSRFTFRVRTCITNSIARSTLAELHFERHCLELAVDSGALSVILVTQDGHNTTIFRAGDCVAERVWVELEMDVNVEGSSLLLTQHAIDRRGAECFDCVLPTTLGRLERLVLAGKSHGDRIVGAFDGKMEAPQIVSRAHGLEACWDLGSTPFSSGIVRDTTVRHPDATLVNAPTRAVTSSLWRGQSDDYRVAPQLYAATHFHRDDLEDVRWPQCFELTAPTDARSGAYALILADAETPTFSDLRSFYPLPLFVVPLKPQARIALVLPTYSYRAYANWIAPEATNPLVFMGRRETVSKPVYEDISATGFTSLYDHHVDGSGVHLASLLRPQSSVRPDWVSMQLGFPHQFSADLFIVRWLEQLGHSYDTLCDEVLEQRGSQALAPYDIAITGSHPEYTSPAVLEAYLAHQDAGGSMMYLGGNGFYWCVGIDPDRPQLIEVRRADGTRTWSAQPGESRHETDGRQGGIWRRQGLPPNGLVGIGFSAMGFSADGAYVVPPETDIGALPVNLRAVFRQIGDKMFGVAGLELDRYDPELAAFSSIVIVGRTKTLPAGYHPPIEDVAGLDTLLPNPDAAFGERAKGNVAFLPLAAGGACFSVGSIRWTSALLEPGDSQFVRAITTAALNDLLAESF